MIEAIEIFEKLCTLNLLAQKPLWWWERAGSFEVCAGAILVQNSKWENAFSGIESMRTAGLLSHIDESNAEDENLNSQSLQRIANCDFHALASHIRGLQNTKAAYLQNLARNILQDFGSFGAFRDSASKQWLLAQKGLGFESADCILNYACKKEVMVVDRYTFKMLCALGVEIPDYRDLQAFFENGICENFERAQTACKMDLQNALDSQNGLIFQNLGCDFSEFNADLALIFARFHAMIVEASRRKISFQNFRI